MFLLLLFSYNPVFAVLSRVLGVIVFFKRFEMIMQYLLNDILFPWFIDGQTVLQKPLHLTRMEDGGTAIKGYLISYTVSALNYKWKKVMKCSKCGIRLYVLSR